MKLSRLKRANLIALAAVAVLAVAGLDAYLVKAAKEIDMEKDATITVQIGGNEYNDFNTHYEGIVDVDFYKIADYTSTGAFVLDNDFAGAEIDLSVMENSPTVEDIQTSIVDKAQLASDGMEPDFTLSLDRSTADSVTSDALDKGLYLYIPRPCDNDRYSYEFISYVVATPTSKYVEKGDGSDEWEYDATVTLKPAETQRLGDLKIVKTLDSYNTSMQTASFVYEVKAELDGEIVFNNVYAIDFDTVGTKSVEIKDLPATAKVTVTEVYSGASYSVVGDGATTVTVEADKFVEANFVNTYDGKLNVGGSSQVNKFVKGDDGNFTWVGNNVDSDDAQ